MLTSERAGAPSAALTAGLSWPLLAAAAAFLLALASAPRLLTDGDVYWHLAAGRWILEQAAVPSVDPFSLPARGLPWTAHEWLAEVVFAGAYALGGWAGTVIVAAAAFALALALLNRFLLRHLEPIYALLFTAMSASLLAGHLLARPHTLAAPLIAAWGIGLVSARGRRLAPPWRLAWLMLLWANLHGSFVLGLGLVVVFGAEAVLAAASAAARRSAAADWGRFLAVATVAALATPSGPGGLLFALEVNQMPFALSVIGEWRPADFRMLQPLELWLLIAGAAILFRGLQLPPVRIVLLLALLHLALKHARHADLMALLAPAVIAQPFAAQWSAGRDAARQVATLDRFFACLAGPATPLGTALVLALLAMAAGLALRSDAIRPAETITPEAAVRAANDSGVRGPVLNAYEYGGYLIHSGTPPFIDGRADLYGDAFLKKYVEAITLGKPDALHEILQGYRIGWTLLSVGTPAIALLDQLPGWRRLHADAIAVVHVREPRAGARSASQLK